MHGRSAGFHDRSENIADACSSQQYGCTRQLPVHHVHHEMFSTWQPSASTAQTGKYLEVRPIAVVLANTDLQSANASDKEVSMSKGESVTFVRPDQIVGEEKNTIRRVSLSCGQCSARQPSRRTSSLAEVQLRSVTQTALVMQETGIHARVISGHTIIASV